MVANRLNTLNLFYEGWLLPPKDVLYPLVHCRRPDSYTSLSLSFKGRKFQLLWAKMCAAKQPECGQETRTAQDTLRPAARGVRGREGWGRSADKHALTGTHWVLTVLHPGCLGSASCHSKVETQNSSGKTGASD